MNREKIKNWADELSAQQKRELSAKVKMRVSLMMSRLRNRPEDLKLWEVFRIIDFAGEALTQEDFFHYPPM